MNGGQGVVRNLIGKSDHKAEHEWVNDTCKWCAMGRSWPGAKKRCRGGANANQAAVTERRRVAKTSQAKARHDGSRERVAELGAKVGSRSAG